MKTIKFCEYHNERSNTRYYAEAFIVDELPNVGDHVSFIYDDEIVDCVFPANVDCEQNSEVFDYDFYSVDIHDAENEEDIDFIYVAVKCKEDDGYDRWEVEPSRDDWDSDEDYFHYV